MVNSLFVLIQRKKRQLAFPLMHQEERGSKRVRGKRKRDRGPSSRDRGVDQAYDEGATFNPHLKAAILEVVENQIREGDPPETRQTLDRLQAAGYSRKQAVEMIGSAVVEEIWMVLHEKRPYDRERFVAALEGWSKEPEALFKVKVSYFTKQFIAWNFNCATGCL